MAKNSPNTQHEFLALNGLFKTIQMLKYTLYTRKLTPIFRLHNILLEFHNHTNSSGYCVPKYGIKRGFYKFLCTPTYK